MPGCTKDLCCAYCGGVVDWDEEHRYGVCRYCGHTAINIPEDEEHRKINQKLDEAVQFWLRNNPVSTIKALNEVLKMDPRNTRANVFLSYVKGKQMPKPIAEVTDEDRSFVQELGKKDRRFREYSAVILE